MRWKNCSSSLSCLMALQAPSTKRDLKAPLPKPVIEPRRILSPLEFSRGTMPQKALNSLPKPPTLVGGGERGGEGPTPYKSTNEVGGIMFFDEKVPSFGPRRL